MTKGLLGLALLIPVLLIITTQDAYAVVPDCSTATLNNNELYIASENGTLHKADINTNPTKNCKIAPMKVGGVGPNVVCTDIALDPNTNPDTLYCLTSGAGSALYRINRLTAVATFVGPLERDGDPTKRIMDVNGADFDSAGVFYAVSQNGNFWNVDKTNGDLAFRANLGSVSSGDLAYDPVTASMYWSSRQCLVAMDPACAGPAVGDPNDDGLYKINLVTFVPTFIKSLDKRYVFALDFTAIGQLCALTGKFGADTAQQGTFLATTPAVASAIMFKTTSPLLISNGGTAVNLLLGGILIVVDKYTLLLAGIQTNAVWMMPVILVGVGLVAYKFRKSQD